MACTQYETQLFIQHYLGAAAILEGDRQEDNDGLAEWSEEAKAHAAKECEDFLMKAEKPLSAAFSAEGYVIEQAGTDFFLTRNGHGAGFWDRGLGEVGEELSRIARGFGVAETYTDGNVLDFDRSMTTKEKKLKM